MISPVIDPVSVALVPRLDMNRLPVQSGKALCEGRFVACRLLARLVVSCSLCDMGKVWFDVGLVGVVAGVPVNPSSCSVHGRRRVVGWRVGGP